MANNPFDRVVWNPRERPLTNDNNAQAAQEDYSLRQLVQLMFGMHGPFSSTSGVLAPTGFIADSLKADVAGMTVTLRSGLGFLNNPADVPGNINGVLGLNDLSPEKPILLLAPQNITVPAADPGQPRIDLIEVTYLRQPSTNPQTRDVFDLIAKQFLPELVNKTLTWAIDSSLSFGGVAAINYKQGTPGATPAAPAVDAGYTAVAQVYVPAGAVALTAANITDVRRTFSPNGVLVAGVEALVDLVVGSGTIGNIIRGSQSLPPGYKALIATTPVGGGQWAIDFYLEGPDLHRLASANGGVPLTSPTMPTVNITLNYIGGASFGVNVYKPLALAQNTMSLQPLISQPASAINQRFPDPVPTFDVHGNVLHVQFSPVEFDPTGHVFDLNFLAKLHVSISVIIPTAQ